MPLDDRRLAMLREMGVPFWQPLARTDAVEPAELQQLPAAPCRVAIHGNQKRSTHTRRLHDFNGLSFVNRFQVPI